MKLLQCILTANECYKTGRTITPKGVMVHSTGANNPNLKRYVQPIASTPGQMDLLAKLGANLNGNHWNAYHPEGKNVGAHTYVHNSATGRCKVCGGRQVCVHGFIGKLADGSVATVQTLPWNRRGWHSSSGKNGSAQDTHIGFEICEDGLTDPVYFGKVYREAVELTAMLCREYGLNPLADGVVICHAEGWRRGIASNHGDVLNWFPRFGKSMDDFRADVAKAMSGDDKREDDDMKYYAKLKDVPNSYQPTIRKLMERGVLKGHSDPDPNSLEDNVLNISEDYCRVMITLDRLGKLD